MSRREAARLKRAQQQRTDDLRWLMGDVRGRRIVQSIIDSSGVNVLGAFTGNSTTFYTMGRHEFVRGLCNEIREVALLEFRRMEDEAAALERDASQQAGAASETEQADEA